MSPEEAKALAQVLQGTPAGLAFLDQLHAHVRDIAAVFNALSPEVRQRLRELAYEVP